VLLAQEQDSDRCTRDSRLWPRILTRRIVSVGYERPGPILDGGPTCCFAGPLKYMPFDEIPKDHRRSRRPDSEQVPDDPVGDTTVLTYIRYNRYLDLTTGVTSMSDRRPEPCGGGSRKAVADPMTTCRRIDRLNERGGGIRHPLQRTSGASNTSKGASDPAAWLPPNAGVRCTYAAVRIEVKAAWGLTADQAEIDALTALAATCSYP